MININGLVCYIRDVWGESDDIQFILEAEDGDEITDEEVYEIVRQDYADLLEWEYFENLISYTDFLD